VSIPKRLFRVAADRLRREFADLEIEFEARRPRDPASNARRELEDFLRDGAASRRAAPPPDPLAPDYALLGLKPDADRAAIQRAWHRCVRETHPDRFAYDPTAAEAARERFHLYQQAYERIIAARGEG
jgi:DnaJ-domain-containing protein 1